MSIIDRALIKHRLRSRTNPVAMLVAETQFLAAALNQARYEVERQRDRADALLRNVRATNRAAGLEPDEICPPPSLPLAEREARERAGMPSGHPDNLAAVLPEAQEEAFAALTWDLDRNDEDITAEGDAS
jgi:hypothetical protein